MSSKKTSILPVKLHDTMERWAPVPYGIIQYLRHHASQREKYRSFVNAAPLDQKERCERLAKRLEFVHFALRPPHSHEELLEVVKFILFFAPERQGVVVEAGSYRGASAAKLSAACKVANRRLAIFDSFKGLPHGEAPQTNIFGDLTKFGRGEYAGSLHEVRRNIARYGVLELCDFHEGWFEETMPAFSAPVIAAYVDVDLVSSTKTCLKKLYPLLVPGGRIFSQDGHLPLVIDLLQDDQFWREEVGFEKPRIDGLGVSKLVTIHKG